MNPATLVALREFPDRLAAFFAAIPVEHRNFRPTSWDGVPSEPFTPIEQICHVRDIEIDGYHARLRRTLDETEPYLPNIDGEALARERNYAQADPGDVLTAFRAARATTLELIASLDEREFARTAVFDGAPVTLRSLVHFLCSHDQQHLAGLQWLLARIEARG